MDSNEKRILQYAATIKKYRKLRNMSQEDLSNTSGINVSTIKKYEAGFRNPKYEQLEKIASALGINVNSFYDNSIGTNGELLSALINIESQTDMIISGDKDEDGNYDPDSISIKFKDKSINELISQYLKYKNDINDKTDKDNIDESVVEKLILSDTPIKKSPK